MPSETTSPESAPREPEPSAGDRAGGDRPLKVTDRRMFTPDGRLREEYRHLEEGRPRPAPAAPSEPPRPEPAKPPPPKEPPVAAAPDAAFLDLVAMIAEPASIYLQRARVVDGDSAQNLELARLHVDLLDVLQRKTRGNLHFQEQQYLDDALHQLRMAFVETAR